MDRSCWDEKNFTSCCEELDTYHHNEWTEKIFNSPMPFIGVYIAAASLVCSLAMAADLIHGIRRKKLWFPCKFFTINAASLTILAVAMKLPVDLAAGMWSTTNNLANVSSNVFMTTVMGNFLTCLASMDNNAIFLNITALGILVLTIIMNDCIKIRNLAMTDVEEVTVINIRPEAISVIIFMLVLLLILTSSALMTPTTKRYLELKYSELHKKASNGGKIDETRKLTNQKLKEVVEKYWVMAETGSPQFVMARSVTAAMSGVICLLTTLTLAEAVIRLNVMKPDYFLLRLLNKNESYYQWSTSWILWIQCIGVVLGTVAPMFRWFIVISLNFSNGDSDNHHDESKLVEYYWIQKLVEWKERPLAVQFRSLKCRKFVHFTKNLFLDLCIGIQFGIVVASKAVRFISITSVRPLVSFCYCCKTLKRSLLSECHTTPPVNHENAEPKTLGTELDLSDYVLLLEGEAKLPKWILHNIHHDMNQLIQKGKRQQPKSTIELLQKSNKSLKGVSEFDSSQVPDILHEKPPNCWTLPAVTLTSIAIALPNIENQMVDKLLSSVSEGLLYVNRVDKSFISKGDDFLNMVKQAADVVWVRVEHHRKWMSVDLRKLALEKKTSKETVQSLVEIAEKTIIEFQKNNEAGILIENPYTWPAKVIAANSMYRISQTILNNYEGVTHQADENLFDHLSCMIADILGACLTNLPRIVILKCYSSAIEETETNVRDATCLLGEIEEILKILQGYDVPSLEGDRGAFIDEWRASMELEKPPACVGSSSHEIAASCSDELQIAMDK